MRLLRDRAASGVVERNAGHVSGDGDIPGRAVIDRTAGFQNGLVSGS